MRAKPKVSRDKAKELWYVGGFYVNGKRQRKYFETKGQADLYLNRIKAQIEREGQAAWTLSESERSAAAKALEILRPLQADLVEAAKFYAEHLRATSRSITFDSLVERLLDAKRGDGRADTHLSDLKYRLKRVAQTFGNRLVAEITFTEIDDWLRNSGNSPEGRKNYRKVLHAAFAFAQAHEFCDKNPVARVARIKINRGPPAILTSAAMRKLLSEAPDSMIPYIAVCGFAGLRTSEAERLDWGNVDLDRKVLQVSTGNKTGHRWVDLSANLVAWLAPHRRESGPFAPKTAIRIRNRIVEKIGVKWANNCLRHTFGSAHAQHFGDILLTSAQMGNTPRVLLGHYRRLMTREAAKEWFEISPGDNESNVIKLESQIG